jgi:uncharacterized DUF497 family protein
MPFDWDAAKNTANLAKQGIDFRDVVRIFEGRFWNGSMTAKTMAKFE